jgi:putative FmdB family regulatory protein
VGATIGPARLVQLTARAPTATICLVPIYDYACAACDERFEELVRSDSPPPPCPACGDERSERLLSTFLTPNMASGQRRFQRDIGSAMAQMGCCGGGGCGTHAG